MESRRSGAYPAQRVKTLSWLYGHPAVPRAWRHPQRGLDLPILPPWSRKLSCLELPDVSRGGRAPFRRTFYPPADPSRRARGGRGHHDAGRTIPVAGVGGLSDRHAPHQGATCPPTQSFLQRRKIESFVLSEAHAVIGFTGVVRRNVKWRKKQRGADGPRLWP